MDKNNTHNHEGCSCCNHEHNHEHEHNHNDKSHTTFNKNPEINSGEKKFLFELIENKYLPISEFIMNNSENEEIGFIAFHPVYIETVNDTMDDIKKNALILCELEKKGLISLDYDIPIESYEIGRASCRERV